MSVSSVKPNSLLSKRPSAGPHVFQMSHAAQNTVMYSRKRGVPMNRAMPSDRRPKRSLPGLRSGRNRARNPRRAAFGWSMRSAMLTTAARHVGDVVVLAPVLGQHVVEHVVDAHGPEQTTLGVEHGER